MNALFLISILSGARVSTSSAFLSPHGSIGNRLHQPVATTTRSSADGSDVESLGADPKDDGSSTSPFALPPVGASSFQYDADHPSAGPLEGSDHARPGDGSARAGGIVVSDRVGLVSPKFQLQYTCKVCSTRNSVSVTRLAYRKGVVIAVCKGCHSKHLIADNFGWVNGFDFDGGERDIEAYMQNRDREAREGGAAGGKENDLVMRVNRDVFDLETMLYRGEGEDALSAGARGEEGDDRLGDAESWS